TLPVLKKQLDEIKKMFDIEIKICKDTIYCFDNESFRFLAAHLINYSSHKINDTISLNNARLLILYKPLTKVNLNIQENIAQIEKLKKEIQRSDITTKELKNQDLANAIQKAKSMTKISNDASVLLTFLMQKKLEDPRWVVDFELNNDNSLIRLLWMSSGQAVDKVPIVMFTDEDPALDATIPIAFSETYSAHCIFHIAQNLPKNLKAKFERWNKLLNDFPMTKDYLLCVLDLKCCSWAQAYLYRIFIAGIESTSRFHDYRQAVMMNTIPIAGQDLFPEIINVIDEYLTEPISNAIKMEMSQCLFVSANKIEPSFEELHHEQHNENHDVPKRLMASEVSDNAWEIQTNETSDQTEESKTETETEESQNMNEVNLENIKNPNKVSTRG
ncbi:14198_t:CDS:2, partial [Cetraspora pellucida]